MIPRKMTKQDLVVAVSEKLDTTQTEASKLIDGVFDTISEALKTYDEVKVAGFGIFSAKMSTERTTKSPMGGQDILVPAKRRPGFRAAKQLKESL